MRSGSLATPVACMGLVVLATGRWVPRALESTSTLTLTSTMSSFTADLGPSSSLASMGDGPAPPASVPEDVSASTIAAASASSPSFQDTASFIADLGPSSSPASTEDGPAPSASLPESVTSSTIAASTPPSSSPDTAVIPSSSQTSTLVIHLTSTSTSTSTSTPTSTLLASSQDTTATPSSSQTSTLTIHVTSTSTSTSISTPTSSQVASIFPSANSSAIATAAASQTPSDDFSGDVCSTDGELLCNGPSLFGLCNWGQVVWQDVAPGTSCMDGKIGYAPGFGSQPQVSSPTSGVTSGLPSDVFQTVQNGVTMTSAAPEAASDSPPPPDTPPGSPPPADGPKPQLNQTGPWTTVSCTFGAVTDALSDTVQRWNDAQASAAWQNVVDSWNNYYHGLPPTDPNFFGFSTFVWQFFHGPDNQHCQTTIGPCDAESCVQGIAPAGFLIRESLANIHGFYASLSDALSKANNEISNELAEFTDAFIPSKGLSAAQIVLDSLTFVTGLGQASFWQVVKPLITKEAADGLKDGINFAIGSSYALGQQFANLHRADKVEDLRAVLQSFTDTLSTPLETTLETLMNGTDPKAVTAVGGLIASGNMLRPANGGELPSLLDNTAKSLLYGGLLRGFWNSQSTDEDGPTPAFVLYVPNGVYQCGDDPKKAGIIAGDSDNLAALVSNDAAKGFQNVYCDPHGNSFFLLKPLTTSFDGRGLKGVQGGDPHTLDGTKWGGITLETITQSAFQGFMMSKNNSADIPPPTGPDFVASLGDTTFDAGTPGFFDFPVCFSVSTVLRSIQTHLDDTRSGGRGPKPLPNGWPCPDDGGAGQSQFFLEGLNGFAPGKCNVGWTIYHKPGDKRVVDINVKDGASNNVALQNGIEATPPKMPDPVKGGRFPGEIDFFISDISKGHSADEITFTYGTQKWKTSDKKSGCVIGTFDSGKANQVSGTCPFDC